MINVKSTTNAVNAKHSVRLPLQFAIPTHEAVKSVALVEGAVVSASFSFSFACFLMLLLSRGVSPSVLCLLKY